MQDKYAQFKKISEGWKLLVAADIVTYAFINKKLHVLMVQRKFEPGIGKWGIPGGFVRENESLEQAAVRELREETGLSKGVYLEQLYTFGELGRDIRTRVISVAYLLLVNDYLKVKLKASDDAADVKWYPVDKLPELAFEKSHKEILDYARQRLRWKFEYTNVALNMLPNKFTLSEVQKLYEVVLNEEIDKRNFRKKILSLDFVEPLDEMKKELGRPAQLYKAQDKELKIYTRIV